MTTQPSQPVLWYTLRQGVESGPFDDAEIERQVDAGYLEADDLLWSSGRPDWLPVAKIMSVPPPSHGSRGGDRSSHTIRSFRSKAGAPVRSRGTARSKLRMAVLGLCISAVAALGFAAIHLRNQAVGTAQGPAGAGAEVVAETPDSGAQLPAGRQPALTEKAAEWLKASNSAEAQTQLDAAFFAAKSNAQRALIMAKRGANLCVEAATAPQDLGVELLHAGIDETTQSIETFEAVLKNKSETEAATGGIESITIALAAAYKLRGLCRKTMPDRPGAIADFKKALELYGPDSKGGAEVQAKLTELEPTEHVQQGPVLAADPATEASAPAPSTVADASPPSPGTPQTDDVNAKVNAALEQLLTGNAVDSTLAALTLHSFGKAAVPALISVLSNPRPLLRNLATVALGNIGADAEAAVPSLVNRLSDGDPAEREFVAEALGRINSRADIAVPALQALANDPNENVRAAVATALRSIKE